MPTQTTTRDTLPEAELVHLGLIRKQPAAVRLRDACSASRRVITQCKNAIRRRYPDLSADEIGIRFIELNYGKELADEVRNWALSRRSRE